MLTKARQTRLVEILRSLPVTSFGLSICYTPSTSTAAPHRDTPEALVKSTQAERYLAEFDLDAFVDLLRTKISTLNTIVVTLEGVPGRPFAKAAHEQDCAGFRMYTAEIANAGGVDEAGDGW